MRWRAHGPPGEDRPGDTVINGSLGAGPQLGERYTDDEVGLEVLCSCAGAGALTPVLLIEQAARKALRVAARAQSWSWEGSR